MIIIPHNVVGIGHTSLDVEIEDMFFDGQKLTYYTFLEEYDLILNHQLHLFAGIENTPCGDMHILPVRGYSPAPREGRV